MTGRELAWRVFAHEFQASTQEETSAGDRPVRHVLSPLGARMNRVLVVGTISVPESVGKDPAAPFLRARLTDPTGSFTVTAGGFQPRALAGFQAIAAPQRSVVVGKAHLFSGRDGVAYGSVRAEAIRRITEGEYRSFLGEALGQTERRTELMEALRSGRAPRSVASGVREGVPPAWWLAAGRCAERYPSIDHRSLRVPLEAVAREIGGSAPLPTSTPSDVLPSVRRTHARAPEPKDAPSAAERAEEAAFLDIVDDLAEGSADGYADLRETFGLAERRGITAARAEELLGALEEAGVIEEPVVGKLRRA